MTANFFSSDAFLQALAAARHPGTPFRVGTVRVDTSVYRVLHGPRGPVLTVPFLDFLEPLDLPVSAAGGDVRNLRWLPAVCHGEVTAAEWEANSELHSFEPSPMVRWRAFADWSSYGAWMHDRPGRGLNYMDRAQRRAEREIGALRYTHDEPDPAAMQQILGWKSAQYVRSGYSDLFAHGPTRRMFELLHAGGTLTVSTLSTGDAIVAGHIGVRWNNRFYYWVPSYDTEFTRHSVGLILLGNMLRSSFEAGDEEFDFLVGGEDYKWKFANHTRLIGPLGHRWWQDGVWLPARRRAVALARRNQRAYDALRSARRRVGR
jgi:hypothetical protein